MTALRHLSTLADQRKAQRVRRCGSPNFPAQYIPRSKYNDRDANRYRTGADTAIRPAGAGLTRCIVDYLNLSGPGGAPHFATRLQSTGTYRADRSAGAVGKFIPSPGGEPQQRAGLPDVFAVVEGRAVLVEVKAGKDRLSAVQKETISDLERAGAAVYVAHSLAGFHAWFTAEFTCPPFA